MIDSVKLNNFKSHTDTNIDFGRLTALVGPNSSGKSSVLQAIRFISQAVSLEQKDNANPVTAEEKSAQERHAKQLLQKGQDSFALILRGHNNKFHEWNEWNVSFNTAPLLDINMLRKLSVVGKTAENEENLLAENAEDLFKVLHLSSLADLQAIYLKIVAENLAAPSYTDEIPPTIEQNGRGLASAVAYLMTYEPERFQNLQNMVRKVIPSLIRIRVRPARIRIQKERVFTMDSTRIPLSEPHEVIGHELIFDMAGGDGIPANMMSEGTLHAAGILTALFSPDSPDILLLDDVEQGLHPKAQREMIGVFRDLLEIREDLQIVLTTHSPYIADELDASQIWVLCQNESGRVVSSPLSDHPDAERALQVLTTGEFLSAEGVFE
jgi:ABC-type branched-subunit amino acid transport system ATPase component